MPEKSSIEKLIDINIKVFWKNLKENKPAGLKSAKYTLVSPESEEGGSLSGAPNCFFYEDKKLFSKKEFFIVPPHYDKRKSSLYKEPVMYENKKGKWVKIEGSIEEAIPENIRDVYNTWKQEEFLKAEKKGEKTIEKNTEFRHRSYTDERLTDIKKAKKPEENSEENFTDSGYMEVFTDDEEKDTEEHTEEHTNKGSPILSRYDSTRKDSSNQGRQSELASKLASELDGLKSKSKGPTKF